MKKNNPLITGTLVLTATGFLSRLIGFFYRTFLSRTFGAEGMGIYQLMAPVIALSFSLTAAGIQTAVSKFVASETTTHDVKSSLRTLTAGFMLSFSLSLGCTFVVYHYADTIAASFLLEPRTAPLLRIFSLSIPFSAVHSLINGYFYGIKSTKIPAFTQILEQFVRVGSVFAICHAAELSHIPPTISYAALGLTLGECASMSLSLLAIYFRFYRTGALRGSFNMNRRRLERYSVLIWRILTLSLPLTANRIAVNILQSIEAVSIPHRLTLHGFSNSQALASYGVLTGMAMPLILFPSALTNSICVLLLPVVSEADAANNRQAIRRAVSKSIRYCTIFGILCTACFLIFGQFAGTVLFHSQMAGSFIITLSFICPFLYLSGTLTSILHGLGKTAITFLFNIMALSIRLLFVFFLIPIVGIQGYLWGLLVSQLIVTALDMAAVRYYTAG